eukprot:Tamp_36951.p1 GENE.Tamp_36951~~Tamp_36951.p1  ORF type:complete len:110 (+),score=7.52 Tamp_36951:122-451(+)
MDSSKPRCCSSSSFYLSLSPLSPALSRSRSLSVRAHSRAENTQHTSDCALFLSLARPRSFARARAHSLSLSLSFIPSLNLFLSLSLSLSPHTHSLAVTRANYLPLKFET